MAARPWKIYDMVKSVVDNVSKPVTVKMRIGWDEDHIYAVENARMAERQGLCNQYAWLHARPAV